MFYIVMSLTPAQLGAWNDVRKRLPGGLKSLQGTEDPQLSAKHRNIAIDVIPDSKRRYLKVMVRRLRCQHRPASDSLARIIESLLRLTANVAATEANNNG